MEDKIQEAIKDLFDQIEHNVIQIDYEATLKSNEFLERKLDGEDCEKYFYRESGKSQACFVVLKMLNELKESYGLK